MASSNQTSIYHVKPQDFNITWGTDSKYWRLADNRFPTAELKYVGNFAVSGKVRINPLKRNEVRVSFEVAKTSAAKGWDKEVNVRIGVKIGENVDAVDRYSYKSVTSQLASPKKAEEKFLVSEVFEMGETPSASDSYLYFGLVDVSNVEKGGLRLYQAIIEVREI